MATSEKMKEDVTKLVEDALRDATVAGIESEIKVALQTAEQTITMLQDKLSALEKTAMDRVTALESLEIKNEELSTEAAAKSNELAQLVEANKALTERAELAETELNTIKRDMLIRDRMAMLDSLKIARSGEARDKQASKIGEMSDEDFAAYKDDMQALRAEFLATIPAAQAAVVPEVSSAVEADTTSDESTETTTEEIAAATEGTPPADVSSALEETSTTLVNAETASVDNKWVEYRNRFSIGLTKMMETNRGPENDKR